LKALAINSRIVTPRAAAKRLIAATSSGWKKPAIWFLSRLGGFERSANEMGPFQRRNCAASSAQ
jgi:hypothetical protein